MASSDGNTDPLVGKSIKIPSEEDLVQVVSVVKQPFHVRIGYVLANLQEEQPVRYIAV